MTDQEQPEMTDEEVKEKLSKMFTETFEQLKAAIATLPPSRSFYLAITKLEEAEMWFKKGIL